MAQPKSMRLVTEEALESGVGDAVNTAISPGGSARAILEAAIGTGGGPASSAPSKTYVPDLVGNALYSTESDTGRRAKVATGAGITDVHAAGTYVAFEQGGASLFVPGRGGLDPMPTATNFAELAGWGSSTMSGFRPALQALGSELGFSYHHGGVGAQIAGQILARLSTRLAVFETATIPSSGPVSLTSPNMASNATSITIPGSIAGVHGILTKESSATIGKFVFTRDTAGSATPAPAGTPLIPDEGPAHRAAVTILNVGKNDTGANGYGNSLKMPELIAETKRAYDYVSGLGKHVLVMGHYVNPDMAPDGERDAIILNDFYKSYGPRFLDLNGYITGSEVWTDTGISPTAGDLAYQEAGQMPRGLSADGVHMDAAVYVAFTQNVIGPRLQELGWYDTIEPSSTGVITSDTFDGPDTTSTYERITDVGMGGEPLMYGSGSSRWGTVGGKLVVLNAGGSHMTITRPPEYSEDVTLTLRVTSNTQKDFYAIAKADTLASTQTRLRLSFIGDGLMRMDTVRAGTENLGDPINYAAGDTIAVRWRESTQTAELIINGTTKQTRTGLGSLAGMNKSGFTMAGSSASCSVDWWKLEETT